MWHLGWYVNRTFARRTLLQHVGRALSKEGFAGRGCVGMGASSSSAVLGSPCRARAAVLQQQCQCIHVVVLSDCRVVVPRLQLRLDAKIPGTVLLRDKNGGVFYITIENVQQVRPD